MNNNNISVTMNKNFFQRMLQNELERVSTCYSLVLVFWHEEDEEPDGLVKEIFAATTYEEAEKNFRANTDFVISDDEPVEDLLADGRLSFKRASSLADFQLADDCTLNVHGEWLVRMMTSD